MAEARRGGRGPLVLLLALATPLRSTRGGLLLALLRGSRRLTLRGRFGLPRGDLPEDPLDSDGTLFRIVHRRLDHADEEDSLPGRLVGFDDVERVSRPQDP